MRRRLLPGTAIAVLAVLTVALWVLVFARSSSSPAAAPGAERPDDPVDAITATPGQDVSHTGPHRSPRPTADGEPLIETAETRFSAAPHETVLVRGAVEGVDPGTRLRVQYLRGQRWRSFPLPVATGTSGRFTAYVELGAPGIHQLRILDPGSGTTSPALTLEVG